MRRIYLDYAASTPMAPEVKKAIEPYFGYPPNKGFGNPGSLHFFGQEAMAAVDKSRELIAKAIGADFREIIFTSSATEANNLALRGAVKAIRTIRISSERPEQIRTKRIRMDSGHSDRFAGWDYMPKIIISAIEHPSILETARDLGKEGIEVIYIPVDKNGLVDLKKFKEALNERTILVSIMYANNEIGTIEPIKEIAEIVREFKTRSKTTNSDPRLQIHPNLQTRSKATNTSESTNRQLYSDHSDKFVDWDRYPFFHTDAVQAFQYLNCQVSDLKVDLMTLSAHKIYGPKGIGALYIRNQESGIREQESGIRNQGTGIRGNKTIIHNSKFIIPIITGGGQEFGLRSGTENVPLIVGFSEAVKIISHSRPREVKKMNQLGRYFWKEIKKIFPRAKINGFEPGQEKRLPNIFNISFKGYSAEELLIKFDLNGLAVSTGSACSARAFKPSTVLQALGLSQNRIQSSLRFSFGKFLTISDIKEALKKIKAVL